MLQGKREEEDERNSSLFFFIQNFKQKESSFQNVQHEFWIKISGSCTWFHWCGKSKEKCMKNEFYWIKYTFLWWLLSFQSMQYHLLAYFFQYNHDFHFNEYYGNRFTSPNVINCIIVGKWIEKQVLINTYQSVFEVEKHIEIRETIVCLSFSLSHEKSSKIQGRWQRRRRRQKIRKNGSNQQKPICNNRESFWQNFYHLLTLMEEKFLLS